MRKASRFVALVAVVACGDKKDSSSAAPPAAPAKSAPAPATPPAPAPATAAPDEIQTDLCKGFDRDAVAATLGWQGMQKVSGTGSKQGETVERHCSYRALGGADGGFGAAFSTDLAFEKRHAGWKLDYKARDAIDGMEAWSGRTDRVVGLQVIAKGIRISTNVRGSGTPDELEPKLVDATKKLVATLPADPKAVLSAR